MGADVTIPSSYNIHLYPEKTMPIDVDLQTVGNGLEASLSSWPDNTLKLGDMNVHVKELPTLSLSVEKLPDINLRLKEIPDTRAHLPAHFEVGFSILGLKLFSISLCGEAQLITEKYVPHRLELCP
jgi:hypothetical protein